MFYIGKLQVRELLTIGRRFLGKWWVSFAFQDAPGLGAFSTVCVSSELDFSGGGTGGAAAGCEAMVVV
jgi:hypothetical protein